MKAPWVLLCLGLGGTAAAAPLDLASTVWPPFTGESGQARVATQLVERALERAGFDSTHATHPEGTLTNDLKGGKFAGSEAFWRSPEREAFLLYSGPYMENRLVLVGQAGSPVDSISSLEELRQTRLGLVKGYAYGEEVDGVNSPTWIRAESDIANLRALAKKEIDYVLVDELVAHRIEEEHPEKTATHFAIGRRVLVHRSLHFVLRKNYPNAETVMAKFNEAIGEMMVDGTYHEILKIDWLHADSDGDGVDELVLGGKAAGLAPPSKGYDVISPEGLAARKRPKKFRYVIEGRTYDSWDKIPQRYKVSPERAVGSGRWGFSIFSW